MARFHARIVLGISTALFYSIAGPATGRQVSRPILNPQSYASPSSEYALFVDPSDLHGRGKAAYKLTRDGQEVWSAEKPYTLQEAVVADDGSVAGYAYSHGWAGFAEAGYAAGMGDFRIVIVDPRGRERLDQATKCDR